MNVYQWSEVEKKQHIEIMWEYTAVRDNESPIAIL